MVRTASRKCITPDIGSSVISGEGVLKVYHTETLVHLSFAVKRVQKVYHTLTLVHLSSVVKVS